MDYFRIDQICDVNPPKDISRFKGMELSFISMDAVSTTGEVDISRTISGDGVKNYSVFQNRDVLFAKITPCMENGKGGIAVDLVNGAGFGSTEFHVLRPIEGVSDPYWLYIITMFPKFRIDAEKVMTGSGGQRRVPISYLNEYVISLPPIDLQKQFAIFVCQTDKSKYKEVVSMPGNFNEQNVEDMVIHAIQANGWEYIPANDLHRAESDVLVESDLRDALIRLNPCIAENHPKS